MKTEIKQVGGNHYSSEYQHWDLAARLALPYFEGTATKYLVRWRRKGGVEDLKKALTYVQMLRKHAHALVKHSPRKVYDLDFIRGELAAFFDSNPQILNSDKEIIERIVHWENSYDLIWVERDMRLRIAAAETAGPQPVPLEDGNKHADRSIAEEESDCYQRTYTK